MTDTTDTTVHENSVLSWFTGNINNLPFEGRSAVVDIARMIVQAADGESAGDERRNFNPVIEQELVAPEYCSIPRDDVDLVYWDPGFSGYGRAVANVSYIATTLASELGTKLLTADARPAPIGAQIIGSNLYETCPDFWLPIPANSLGFEHPRAIFHVFPGDFSSAPDFMTVVAFNDSTPGMLAETRRAATKIHDVIIERSLRESPFRGTAHTVTVGHGGIQPCEVLDLASETRDTLFLEDHVWKSMDNQMKIFGETGDRLENANIRTSRGVLLQGWPGCGKTKMVRVYANELSNAGITVIMADTAAARQVQEIIDYAKTFDKAVVVLEDIDSVVGPRGASSLSAFLNAMDGVSQQNRIVTIATTNDGTALDPAVIRPGRIDAVVDVGSLNKRAIVELVSSMSTSAGYDVDAVAISNAILARTHAVTGAMLEGLILNAILSNDSLTTESLTSFVESKWEIDDPRKSFLDVYGDRDDEELESEF